MKILEGKLFSKKLKDTYVVEVSRVKPHPLYKKLVKLSKKYKVVNTGFEDVEVGTQVKIHEIRPVSKDKYFKIFEVVSHDKKKTKKATKKTTTKGKEEPKKAKSK